MTEVQPPGFMNDPISTDSAVYRDSVRAILGGVPGAFAGGIGALNGGAHGVCGASHLNVTQSGTPAMSVDVAAGDVIMTGTVSALQGPYTARNDASVTKIIAAAHATLTRRDLVVARVRHAPFAGVDLDWVIEVVTGTPSGSPVDPAVPANAVVLARVTVAGAATSITTGNITDLRTFAGFERLRRLAVVENTIIKTFAPAGNTDAPVAVPAADWVNLGNIIVPPSTTAAFVQMNVSGIHSLGGTTIAFLRTSIGTVNGTEPGIVDTTAASKRLPGPCWAANILAPPTGSQALKVRVDNVGPNVLRADSACSFTAIITFKG